MALHDGVLGRVKVLGRMLADRRVAAAHMPALQAKPQMHPALSDLQTLFTTRRMRLDLTNLTKMGTLLRLRHCNSVNQIKAPCEGGDHFVVRDRFARPSRWSAQSSVCDQREHHREADKKARSARRPRRALFPVYQCIPSTAPPGSSGTPYSFSFR